MSTLAEAPEYPNATTTSEIVVRPWRDPEVEAIPGATLTSSVDVLLYWTPVLGPTPTVMLHRFGLWLAQRDEFTIGTSAFLKTFGGLSWPVARRSIDRLRDFGGALDYVEQDATLMLYVRQVLAPHSQHRRSRLPAYLGIAYADTLRGAS